MAGVDFGNFSYIGQVSVNQIPANDYTLMPPFTVAIINDALIESAETIEIAVSAANAYARFNRSV